MEKLTLSEKLIAIQTELKAPKDKRNNFGGYSYRSAEGILEAVKPLLKKYGVLMTISDDVNMVGNHFYVKATVTVRSGQETAETSASAREEETKRGMDAAQITGSASSYARKYALNGMFCIDDTKDADTDEYMKQQQNAPVQQQPKGVTIPKEIKDAIGNAQNVTELALIWNNNPKLQPSAEFCNLVSEKKKQFA